MQNHLSKRAFLAQLEDFLQTSSHEDLCSIVRKLGSDLSPTDRFLFLKRIRNKNESTDEINIQELRKELESLELEISKTAEQDSCDDYGDYHEDGDSLGPFVNFVEPLTRLVLKVEKLFDQNQVQESREVFQRIFALFEVKNEYEQGISLYDLQGIEKKEIKAKYARAVYLTEISDTRSKALLKLLQQLSDEPPFAIFELFEISPEPLPEWDKFLEDTIEILSKTTGSVEDFWLRDATRLRYGASGLETLALNGGKIRPRAFLDWVVELNKNNLHTEAIAASKKGFEVLPTHLSVRADIAEIACASALVTGDREFCTKALWEAFIAKPNLRRLITIWNDAKPDERSELMQKAAEVLNVRLNSKEGECDSFDMLNSPYYLSNAVLLHALAFGNQWEKVFEMAKTSVNFGWSSGENARAFLVTISLVKKSGDSFSKLSPNLENLWTWYVSKDDSFYDAAGTTELENSLKEIYEGLFAQKESNFLLGSQVQDFVLSSIEGRIDHIVKNTYRKAYNRAAILICGYCEVLASSSLSEASSFFQKVQQKFPRHSALQTELHEAWSLS